MKPSNPTAASRPRVAVPATPHGQPLHCDVLIVGGGINGCGIARDLSGRGLGIVLCEKDDLAQHTSSSSTKLIHGGLRYLEHYEFSLVRKAPQRVRPHREVRVCPQPRSLRSTTRWLRFPR